MAYQITSVNNRTSAAKCLCTVWVSSCVEPNYWVLNQSVWSKRFQAPWPIYVCERKKPLHISTVYDIWHLCFATDGRSYAFPLHIVLTRGKTDVIWRSVTSPFKHIQILIHQKICRCEYESMRVVKPFSNSNKCLLSFNTHYPSFLFFCLQFTICGLHHDYQQP